MVACFPQSEREREEKKEIQNIKYLGITEAITCAREVQQLNNTDYQELHVLISQI